jgi:hypothetical protein
MLGHSIVFQHFMEPEGSIPNSQELSTYSYPEPDQSSPFPFNVSPTWFPWTFLMAYSKAKLKSSGDKASSCFRPFWIGQLHLQTVNILWKNLRLY